MQVYMLYIFLLSWLKGLPAQLWRKYSSKIKEFDVRNKTVKEMLLAPAQEKESFNDKILYQQD